MTTGRINQVTPCLGCPWEGSTVAIHSPWSPLSPVETAQCKRIPIWGLRVASNMVHCRDRVPAILQIIATLWHSNHTSAGGEQHNALAHRYHTVHLPHWIFISVANVQSTSPQNHRAELIQLPPKTQFLDPTCHRTNWLANRYRTLPNSSSQQEYHLRAKPRRTGPAAACPANTTLSPNHVLVPTDGQEAGQSYQKRVWSVLL